MQDTRAMTGHGFPRARLLAPWGAMLLASLALAGLGRLAVPADARAPGGPTPALALTAAGLGLLCVASVLALDRALLAPQRLAVRVGIPDPYLAGRYLLAGHLVLWVLAAVPAILGFSQVLLGGPLRVHDALCALSLGLLALLMPTDARIRSRMNAVAKAHAPSAGTHGEPGGRAARRRDQGTG